MADIGAKSKFGLDLAGIQEPGDVFWNLGVDELIDQSLTRKEGVLTKTGALSCKTGEHTGRSPQDRFIVKDKTTESLVDWGKVNKPISPEHFAKLRADQLAYLKGKTLFVRDAFGGKFKDRRVAVRVINEDAWSNLFARQLFVRPTAAEAIATKPEFTIVHTPYFQADPAVHGTRTGTFIIVNFSEKLILIGGTRYAGEMKKSIFSTLNFIYPQEGILPMHCSANIAAGAVNGSGDNLALFFGLSGTGKTTLSADPNRRLIGDDEHGWSDTGVFNFEGGCYAKCINLSEEREPQIWRAIRRGAILENVVVNANGEPNYDDGSLTENTRAAYPIDYIDDAVLEGVGGHPKNIIFLTCDAFGVMPPISKLTPKQAMYHFLSGYTAKVAGTEKGVGNTPQATFSACFGSPFLPLAPTAYAELLGEKMTKHSAECWLINTGWIGGGHGVGQRVKLSYTRRMVTAAINGELSTANFTRDPIFGLAIPAEISGVPSEVLNPRSAWTDKAAYDKQAKHLAELFQKNFEKFGNQGQDIREAGPAGQMVVNG